MVNKKVLYKDIAGNLLVERYIKSRNKVQLAAYNKKGQLVKEKDALVLMRRAGLKYKRL